METSLKNNFIQLCQQGVDIESASLHAPDLEPIFLEVLRLVQQHSEHRELFVHLFSEVAFWKIKAPQYLLEFCMRELRYPEVEAQLLQELQGHVKARK